MQTSLLSHLPRIPTKELEERLKKNPYLVDILSIVREPEPKPLKYRVSVPYFEEDAICNVVANMLKRNISSATPPVIEFENSLKSFFGVPCAVACSNGYSSLVLALKAANIGPGDEVLIPSFTMIAVGNAVTAVGATPIFVDSGDGYNPTAENFLKMSTPQTKAIIVTHTYGVPCEMDEIVNLVSQKKWILIEDICECLGVKYKGKLLGTFGSFACCSLYANKIINSGDGGFVISTEKDTEWRMKSLCNHGFVAGYHFLHLESSGNSKMCGLAAAIADTSLRSIDQVLSHRASMAALYRQHLQDILDVILHPKVDFCEDTPWVFCVQLKQPEYRLPVRQYLIDHGIETRNFFLPLHQQPCFHHLVTQNLEFPNSEFLGRSGFYLPTHYYLQPSDIEYISLVLRNALYVVKNQQAPNSVLNFVPSYAWNNLQETKVLEYLLDSSDTIPDGLLYYGLLKKKLRKFFLQENRSEIPALRKTILKTKSIDGSPHKVENLNKIDQYLLYLQTLPPCVDKDIWKNTRLGGSSKVPTLCQEESRQYLKWLVCSQFTGQGEIVELGSFLGGSTGALAEGLENYKKENASESAIHAYDNFIMENWYRVDYYSVLHSKKPGDSFLDVFKKFVAPWTSLIVPNICKIAQDHLEANLEWIGKPIEIFHYDLGETEWEITTSWNVFSPFFIPGKTVIIFNTYGNWKAQGLRDFIRQKSKELKPLHKPNTFAKSFLFVGTPKIDTTQETVVTPTPLHIRKLKITNPKTWDHHRGGWKTVVKLFEENLAASDGTLFISAVEDLISKQQTVQEPWIGFVHQVPETDMRYHPDLKRIVKNPYFKASQKYCRGLFTLNTYIKDYLESCEGLDEIPIISVPYPWTPTERKFSLNKFQRNQDKKILFIGNYLRKYEDFIQLKVPSSIKKMILPGEPLTITTSNDVAIMERISDEEFDTLLEENVVFLSLKDAPAVTTMIECIARNTPLIINRLKGLEEYLGPAYPGFYDSLSEAEQKIKDILIWTEKITEYLEKLETKQQLTPEYFLQSFCQSSIYKALPTPPSSALFEPNFNQYDVTVVMCSYKRVYNLRQILESFSKQNFKGKFDLLIWNNNFEEQQNVQQIVDDFKQQLALRVIHSTQNYYCVIRLAIAHLVMSPLVLICDDDVIPSPEYIQFFMNKHTEYPDSVICCRGHLFREHQINEENPVNVWEGYENLVFYDENVDDRQIHFIHADNCLIPRHILQQIGQYEIPDPNFILVDDYWMSYVISHIMKIPIWKVKASQIFQSTPCADDPLIALFHNIKVQNARIQFYIYHMRRGWPFPIKTSSTSQDDNNNCNDITYKVALYNNEEVDKMTYWERGFHGVNVFSESPSQDFAACASYGVNVARIGAVGDCLDLAFLVTKNCNNFDLGLESIRRLRRSISKLSKQNLKVILTLTSLPGRNFKGKDTRFWTDPTLFSMIPVMWGQIASHFKDDPHIIGYDIMNEPFTLKDLSSDGPEDTDPQQFRLEKLYDDCITAIRQHDKHTPIVVESTYWAHPVTLPFSKIFQDSRIIYSFHFYLPKMLTNRRKNGGFCQYPGKVPKWNASWSETVEWNKDKIRSLLEPIQVWQQKHQIASSRIFVGEFGISRDVRGAAVYLADLIDLFANFGWSWCLYAFREEGWDAMDYELGKDGTNMLKRDPENSLFQILRKEFH